MKKDKQFILPDSRIVRALLVSNGVSIFLFFYRALATDSFWFVFLLWNLILAWVPYFLALWLIIKNRQLGWLSWQSIFISIAWLLFLPNSFYIVSDFIHLGMISNLVADRVLDTAMLFSFTFNAYAAGFSSLYLVHHELLRRISRVWAHRVVAAILLATGFAIYLGRSLRWNSWDILVNPAGLIFDISDRMIDPTEHPEMASITFVYFLLVGSIYYVIWNFLEAKKAK